MALSLTHKQDLFSLPAIIRDVLLYPDARPISARERSLTRLRRRRAHRKRPELFSESARVRYRVSRHRMGARSIAVPDVFFPFPEAILTLVLDAHVARLNTILFSDKKYLLFNETASIFVR